MEQGYKKMLLARVQGRNLADLEHVAADSHDTDDDGGRDGDHSDNGSGDLGQLLFYIELVRCLALCCRDKNMHAIHKVRALIPSDDLLELLHLMCEDYEGYAEVEDLLDVHILLFDALYLETHATVDEIFTHPRIPSVIDAMLNDLKSFKQNCAQSTLGGASRGG
jgi:hypothetical protein